MNRPTVKEIENVDAILTIGQVQVHLDQYEAITPEGRQPLSPLEVRVLRVLAARRGRVVSRLDMLTACHDEYVPATPDAVSRRIQRIRKKLGPAGANIQTVHGQGYKLKRQTLAQVVAATTLGSWLVKVRHASAHVMTATTGKGTTAICGAAVIGGVGVCCVLSQVQQPAPPVRLIAEGTIPARGIMGHAPGPWQRTDPYRGNFGGLGSGIDRIGKSNLFLSVCGRGPQNRTKPFDSRFHILRMDVKKGKVVSKLLSTMPLCSGDGSPLSGSAHAAAPWRRYDPEAVRVISPDRFVVADEYGPAVDEFDMSGVRVRRFVMPSAYALRFSPGKQGVSPREGINRNRGFEALALMPNGRGVVAMLEAPLIQDGGKSSRADRVVKINLQTGAVRQYVYQLRHAGDLLREAVAVDEHRLLVLEQTPKRRGVRRQTRLMLVDMRGATQVPSGVSLAGTGWESSITPMRGRELLRLDDPSLDLPAKWRSASFQGMTLAGHDGRGDQRVIITSDNGFHADRPTRVVVLLIRREALASTQTDRG